MVRVRIFIAPPKLCGYAMYLVWYRPGFLCSTQHLGLDALQFQNKLRGDLFNWDLSSACTVPPSQKPLVRARPRRPTIFLPAFLETSHLVCQRRTDH